jgi:hypothetical protein
MKLSFLSWVIILSGSLWLIIASADYCARSSLQSRYKKVNLMPTRTNCRWQEQAEFARDVAKLIAYIHSQGYSCTFGEAWRSHEQAEIYAREGKGIVQSLHCDRLALDLNLYSPDGVYLRAKKDYEPFGKYWQSLHKKNRWGGCFHDHTGKSKPDSDHFERNSL